MPRLYFAHCSPPTSDMLPRTTDIDVPLIHPSPSVHSPAVSPPSASPIAPQMTGVEGALSKMVRQSLFHGRTINRFSSFVVGGAETWILDGAPEQDAGSGDGTSRPKTHSRLRSTDSDLSASDYRAEARARGVSEADLHLIDARPVAAACRLSSLLTGSLLPSPAVRAVVEGQNAPFRYCCPQPAEAQEPRRLIGLHHLCVAFRPRLWAFTSSDVDLLPD